MPRLVALALVLVVSACSSPPVEPLACTPGESRACVCSRGASGAQVCEDDGSRLGACECGSTMLDGGAADDAGQLEDAAGDAGEPGLDAGEADAGGELDAALEVDAGPPPECDLFTQEGCGAGEACRRSADDDDGLSNVHSGPPTCESAGTVMEWRSAPNGLCRAPDGADLCRRGLFCQTFGQCVRYCELGGAPCPLHPDGETVQTCNPAADYGRVPFCDWR